MLCIYLYTCFFYIRPLRYCNIRSFSFFLFVAVLQPFRFIFSSSLQAHDGRVSFVTTDDLDHVSVLSRGSLTAPAISLLRKATL